MLAADVAPLEGGIPWAAINRASCRVDSVYVSWVRGLRFSACRCRPKDVMLTAKSLPAIIGTGEAVLTMVDLSIKNVQLSALKPLWKC